MLSRTLLNEILAKLTGVNKHTIDRNGLELQKAGILRSKGRGRNAVIMTYEDAKNILLAILGAPTPKRAPDAVRRLDRLVGDFGLTFGETITESLAMPAKDKLTIDLITVNRSNLGATILFKEASEEGGEINQFQLDFGGPRNSEKKKGFELIAKLHGGVITELKRYSF